MHNPEFYFILFFLNAKVFFTAVRDIMMLCSSLRYILHLKDILSLQALSIEEIERIMEETQDAVEYQKVWPFCLRSLLNI